jgi:hypothetical protein
MFQKEQDTANYSWYKGFGNGKDMELVNCTSDDVWRLGTYPPAPQDFLPSLPHSHAGSIQHNEQASHEGNKGQPSKLTIHQVTLKTFLLWQSLSYIVDSKHGYIMRFNSVPWVLQLREHISSIKIPEPRTLNALKNDRHLEHSMH